MLERLKESRLLAVTTAFVTVMAVVGVVAAFVVLSKEPTEVSSQEVDPPILIEPEKRKSFEERARERRERWAKMDEESERRREKLLAEETAREPKKKRKRKITRFRWESPAAARGRIWNVPTEESEEATVEAFLRICLSEADGSVRDCVGIWQVLKNIRMRSCNRGYVRRITECDENGETMLSTMRRAQRHILGMIPARNRRAAWIRQLKTDCEPPPAWTGSENQWDGYYQKKCQDTIALAKTLMEGELPPSVPGHRVAWLPGRPITWGNKCKKNNDACDDVIACRRGLARIPNTKTHNNFWCRPGTPRCRNDVDPICRQYLRLPEGKTYDEAYGVERAESESKSTVTETVEPT